MRDPSREVYILEAWKGEDFPPLDHVGEPEGEGALINAIYNSILANLSETQLVICFGEVCLADNLQTRLEDLRGDLLSSKLQVISMCFLTQYVGVFPWTLEALKSLISQLPVQSLR